MSSREGFHHKGTTLEFIHCTYYQPWQEDNVWYLNQTKLGPLPKPLCYRDFFKGWHQWQPTLINNLPLWHWWKHSDENLKLWHAILNSYHSCSPLETYLCPLHLCDHFSPWNHASILCIWWISPPFSSMEKVYFHPGLLPLTELSSLWCFLVYI